VVSVFSDTLGLGKLYELVVEEGKAFETMLGRMTICWAETEYSIYRVLLHYARVSDPIGRSIFSGHRAKPMMDAITAILENTGASQSRRDNWAFVSSQISAIQKLRDMLTHHLASAWTTKATGLGTFQNYLGWPFQQLVTDIARVRRKENSKFIKVDSALIGNMCHDMRVIVANLERHTAKGRFKPYPPPDPAWLYKFPQPLPRRFPPFAKSPKRQRQQKSSPEKR
jgi:hypothetical protein